ncbi:hypothetical protein [Flavilitoribacter nigricans]|nr:hypothetical protein [Flavilitoribacter nigricans]
MHLKSYLFYLLLGTFLYPGLVAGQDDRPIDRQALVSRQNVLLEAVDTLGSLSVGNGEFAFTVDASGLQTFALEYEQGVSLGTQSQWGWHSIPNPDNYGRDDVTERYETCNDREIPVMTQHSEGRAADAANWLRSNPHRLHLGLIGLTITKTNGELIKLADLQDIDQELDLWTGKITSSYTIEGEPVKVELYGHQSEDQIAFRITSPLIKAGRLRISLRFPYGKECHVCPGYDWDANDKHQTNIIEAGGNGVSLKRSLDSTQYFVDATWEGTGILRAMANHHFELIPGKDQASFSAGIRFRNQAAEQSVSGFVATRENSEQAWQDFWAAGAAIDFSGSTDPRAAELERRIILSQYLTRIQCAGSLPPQETGLIFNSWYGKFHLEMTWWHGVHFALWDRIDLLEKSMWWYDDIIESAAATAEWQGFAGVRWPKMTGPSGRSSPSSVGEFLLWQQPHPLYFAELIYRQRPERATLEKYRDIVFRTAEFMASVAQYNEDDGKYHLCHPLIPAQEIFHATETDDPPFELAYWHYGLSVAQEWRKRLGLAPDAGWQRVIDQLAPLPQADALYLPAARAYEAYTDDDNRRDHPVVLGAYGMLPLSPKIDPEIMGNTFDEIMKHWNWQTTWGWDYPMMAMTAARLGKPEAAIDALFLDAQKNTYLVNGHNYQSQRLRIYLPGNGGLLTAVAMMAAGWDGAPDRPAPGFPADGSWRVKWEGLKKMP